MGILRLIPFLEKSSRVVNISQYSGCTVAIDAYCWLHRGAFTCAEKLARGEKSDLYVNYCMKYVNMLLSHNIKPILVFDGRHLPAKAGTEKKRRQNREMNRKRAAELLRQDKPNEARTFIQRCIDVTHTMAVNLMRQCRSLNVDCITAPYEADAQLAYLNISNIAHIVVTEDSDLILFGCSKVLFKLDLNGNGLMVEQDSLHLSLGLSKSSFSMDKFRYMCILSGCDYLPSLPKIGLVKACRFIKSTVDPDIHRALSRLGGHLNMNITVSKEYRDKFMEADAMFRHQPVFDPLTRRLVPLTPPPHNITPPLLSQEPLSEEQLLDLALGNLDPFSLTRVDDFMPGQGTETGNRQSSVWNMRAPHKSIWSIDFKPKALLVEQPDPCILKHTPTSGKVIERKLDISKGAEKHTSIPNKVVVSKVAISKEIEKRTFSSAEEELKTLCSQFGSATQPPNKRVCLDNDVLNLLEKMECTPPKSKVISNISDSPQKVKMNPFSKTPSPSKNKCSGLSKLAQLRRTPISDTSIVQSRFFGNSTILNNLPHPISSVKTPSELLKDVSNKQASESVPSREIPHKLTDETVDSFMKELDKSATEENLKEKVISQEKENVLSPLQSKHGNNNSKWKSCLYNSFAFKNKNVTPTSVANELREESVEATVGDKKNNLTCRRNPFAKIKREGSSIDYLRFQGRSDTDDSGQETTNNEGTDDSAGNTPFSTSRPQFHATVPLHMTYSKPKIKVGLSKKQSGSCQRSLTMYAFTPKAKLQA